MHAEIDLWHLLRMPFGDSVQIFEIDNYVAVWNFGTWNGHGGAAQPAQVSLHGCAEKYAVPMGRAVDAAITRFDVETSGIGKWHVVVGNMHIKSDERGPALATKQRAVKLLRIHLEAIEPRHKGIPVVRIIIGNNNLTADELKRALQRGDDEDLQWTVHHNHNT